MNTPNNTLYFKNIDWKIKKPLLQRALYSLCTRHGKVLEVIVLRRDGLRGQAFVVMDSVQAATACLQAEQGFNFFEKDMQIEYARDKTKHLSNKKTVKDSDNSDNAKAASDDRHEDDEEAPKAKKPKMSDTGDNLSENGTESADPMTSAPPSKYLLAADLPTECNQMMLSMLFRQYNGFQEVRMPREGMAFVEFDTQASATLALEALQGFQLTADEKLKLDYDKE
jgi:U2 small nuclear ribonucleoprotein B''